jgi:hypothetical protein
MFIFTLKSLTSEDSTRNESVSTIFSFILIDNGETVSTDPKTMLVGLDAVTALVAIVLICSYNPL